MDQVVECLLQPKQEMKIIGNEFFGNLNRFPIIMCPKDTSYHHSERTVSILAFLRAFSSDVQLNLLLPPMYSQFHPVYVYSTPISFYLCFSTRLGDLHIYFNFRPAEGKHDPSSNRRLVINRSLYSRIYNLGNYILL